MKMSDVEATGSGGSRLGAEGSEARRRGLKLPATAHDRAADHGPGLPKPQRHLLNKEKRFSLNACGAWRLLLTASSCLPSPQQHNFMFNYCHQEQGHVGEKSSLYEQPWPAPHSRSNLLLLE